jgi:hypothetical protein
VLRRANAASDTVRDTSQDPGRLFRFVRTSIPGGKLADGDVLRICCVALSATLDCSRHMRDADALAAVLGNSGALSRKIEERLADLPVLDAGNRGSLHHTLLRINCRSLRQGGDVRREL